jgi:hypothetical protein
VAGARVPSVVCSMEAALPGLGMLDRGETKRVSMKLGV